MRRGLFIALLLAGLTLLVYWPAGHHQFIDYDDPQFITENPDIQRGLSWAGVRWAFTHPVAGNWHPVTTLSHMLDCQLFGAHPGPHHLVNVAFHMANAVLLFLLLQELTGATWRSGLAAAIFALHPLRVESVAWVAERKDVLSVLFFLATIWAYARYVYERQTGAPADGREAFGVRRIPALLIAAEPPANQSGGARRAANAARPRPWLFYALALFLYALGLMSKPMVVTLPVVLLLMDFWPLHRIELLRLQNWRPLLLEKLPFVMMSAVDSVLTLSLQHGTGAMNMVRYLSFEERVVNAVVSATRYLGKLFWPTNLAVIYPHPDNGYFLNDRWPAWEIAAAALLLLAITALCWRLARKAPYLLWGWAWYFITLLPVIGLVQVGEQAMADRYTYIPLIGPVVALVWAVGEWVDRKLLRMAGAGAIRPESGRTPGGASGVARGLWCGGILILCALGWLSHRQLAYWQNTVTLFAHTVAVTADNASAHFALGTGLDKRGETRRAMVEYRVALAIDPNYWNANYDLGQIYRKAGQWAAAAKEYEAVLRAQPGHSAARLNLASVLPHLGRRKEAVQEFEIALQSDPDSIEALNNLAWLLATSPDKEIRDGSRAAQLAERACVLSQYKQPVFIGTLAAALAEAGRFSEAVTTAQKAATLASGQGQTALASRNLELLEKYRVREPYRERPD